MKKLLSLAAVITFLVVLSGCNVFFGGTNAITGTGSMTTRSIDASNFTGIYLDGVFNVTMNESPNFSVSLTMQENLFDYLETDVSGGTFNVSFSRGISIQTGNTPSLVINAPVISNIVISGAADLTNQGTITASNLTISVHGASDISLNIDVNSLDIIVEGAGNANLTGNAGDVNIRVDGAGDINAEFLESLHATVLVNGAGNVRVGVIETLDVELNGIGSVQYFGDPDVTSQINGIGTVRQG